MADISNFRQDGHLMESSFLIFLVASYVCNHIQWNMNINSNNMQTDSRKHRVFENLIYFVLLLSPYFYTYNNFFGLLHSMDGEEALSFYLCIFFLYSQFIWYFTGKKCPKSLLTLTFSVQWIFHVEENTNYFYFSDISQTFS